MAEEQKSCFECKYYEEAAGTCCNQDGYYGTDLAKAGVLMCGCGSFEV